LTVDVVKKAYVPIEEREPNKVDELRDWIERIQENCKHDFRLIKEPKLAESLFPGVFVGATEGPTKVSYSTLRLKLVCLNCSKEKETTILSTCPKCLSPMREGECLGAGELFGRKRYFGEDYSYFSIRLQRCTKCNFAVASDEWDR
jgi:hypothetical protein